MDTFYLALMILALAVSGGVVIYLMIKRPAVLKKYWKHLAGAWVALLGGLGVLWLVNLLRGSRRYRGDPQSERKEKEFREELASVDVEIEAELTSVREKEQEVKEELEDIDHIDDEAERLKRLADLWNKRRGR